MSFNDLTSEHRLSSIHGKHPALVRRGKDWITLELAAVGLGEDGQMRRTHLARALTWGAENAATTWTRLRT